LLRLLVLSGPLRTVISMKAGDTRSIESHHMSTQPNIPGLMRLLDAVMNADDPLVEQPVPTNNHEVAKQHIADNTDPSIVTDLIEADLLYQAALAAADDARAYFQATIVRARDEHKMTNKGIGKLFTSPKHEDGITEQSVSKHYHVGKSNERVLMDHRGNTVRTKTRETKAKKTTRVKGQLELDQELDFDLLGPVPTS
jgi:hypothetical protein